MPSSALNWPQSHALAQKVTGYRFMLLCVQSARECIRFLSWWRLVRWILIDQHWCSIQSRLESCTAPVQQISSVTARPLDPGGHSHNMFLWGLHQVVHGWQGICWNPSGIYAASLSTLKSYCISFAWSLLDEASMSFRHLSGYIQFVVSYRKHHRTLGFCLNALYTKKIQLWHGHP